jgi:caa(3)-type oxidase subunit IV
MNNSNSESFADIARRCWMVFGAVVVGTLLMVGTSFAPISNHGLVIGLILLVAAFNATLVAGYLMHLFSERKMIYAVLAFTVFFFVMLMGLTIWHPFDIPTSVQPHP